MRKKEYGKKHEIELDAGAEAFRQSLIQEASLDEQTKIDAESQRFSFSFSWLRECEIRHVVMLTESESTDFIAHAARKRGGQEAVADLAEAVRIRKIIMDRFKIDHPMINLAAVRKIDADIFAETEAAQPTKPSTTPSNRRSPFARAA